MRRQATVYFTWTNKQTIFWSELTPPKQKQEPFLLLLPGDGVWGQDASLGCSLRRTTQVLCPSICRQPGTPSFPSYRTFLNALKHEKLVILSWVCHYHKSYLTSIWALLVNPLLPKSDVKISLCITSDDFTRQRKIP